MCPYHHKFENTYLFGAFSPINGSSLILELPECNTDMFQIFLTELSVQDKDEYKIVFLDNGAFHKARRLKIPPNIGLVFLPPYSPELNPAEKVWWTIKREISMKVFKTLNELADEIQRIVRNIITVQKVKSLTDYQCYRMPFRTIFKL
jgi:transposase